MDTQLIYQIIIPVLTAATGWFFSKLKTSRENKQSDLQLINEAIAPLLKSIAELTAHIKSITAELVEEKKLNLQLMEEKAATSAEVERLNAKVASLEKKIQSLTNLIKKQHHEKTTTSADDTDA